MVYQTFAAEPHQQLVDPLFASAAMTGMYNFAHIESQASIAAVLWLASRFFRARAFLVAHVPVTETFKLAPS